MHIKQLTHLINHSLLRELLVLGGLDDRQYDVAIAVMPVQRFRELCAAYDIDPAFDRASTMLRASVLTTHRRSSSNLNLEAA